MPAPVSAFRRMWPGRAFTLVELLVVVSLVVALGALFTAGLRGGGQGLALQSAQGELAGLIQTARLYALTGGRPTRLLLNVDPAGSDPPRHYLRQLIWQAEGPDGWVTQGGLQLPEGVALMPRDPAVPANLLAPGPAWTRADGAALRSSAFRASGEVSVAVHSPAAERWAAIGFTAAGTTANTGDLVLGSIERLAPGRYGPGDAPLQFIQAEQVRGLSLSSYGLATRVGGRQGF